MLKLIVVALVLCCCAGYVHVNAKKETDLDHLILHGTGQLFRTKDIDDVELYKGIGEIDEHTRRFIAVKDGEFVILAFANKDGSYLKGPEYEKRVLQLKIAFLRQMHQELNEKIY